MSPTKKLADYFLLSYYPKNKMLKEYLRVTPAGFMYRKQTFGNVEQVRVAAAQHTCTPHPSSSQPFTPPHLPSPSE